MDGLGGPCGSCAVEVHNLYLVASCVSYSQVSYPLEEDSLLMEVNNLWEGQKFVLSLLVECIL